MDVTFNNENPVEIAKEKRVKLVSPVPVCAFRSDGKATTRLHELTPLRSKYWQDNFLLENTELAIKTIAIRAKEHAAEILARDVGQTAVDAILVSSLTEILWFHQHTKI